MIEAPSPHSPEGPATPPMEEAPAEVMHDWSAFYDAEGRIYYYNSATEESSWDPPENFNPLPPQEKELTGSTGVGADDVAADIVADEGTTKGTWEAYTDDQGRGYYYNSETGETQWEHPASMAFVVDEAGGVAPEETQSPVAMDVDRESEQDEQKEEEIVEEEIIDPAMKAEQALNEPDAIMEPGCLNNVHQLVTKYGGSMGGQMAIQALIASFHGQTAISGLLGLWLTDLKASSSSTSPPESAKQEETFNSAADEVREIAQDVINRIAMERFSKTGGDNILNLSKAEVEFLEEMIVSPRWRKLLIDLSATNKDSALLMYCLQSISKRGHHREIAKRINQSDHFAVYNAMLASECSVVGNLGTSATMEAEASMDLSQIVEDLRRTSTSTCYTYLYAIELLRVLLEKAKKVDLYANEESHLQSAVRKWERLREELESAMIDPAVSSATAGSSLLFRKRRLDIGLTMSDLQQRQRRRTTSSSEANEEDMDMDEERSELESALQNLLRRYSLGASLDDRVLDKLLPVDGAGNNSNAAGQLLIEHPLSVKALLGQLFKPGSSRASSMGTRSKCARLIALSILASGSAVGDEQEVDFEAEESPAEKLMGTLLTASQLCELLENMMTFEVISDPDIASDDSSAGRKLSALALRNAPIAQGVILWATDIVQEPEFVTSASYPTLSPSILSLVRVTSGRHPFTRRAALDVALSFLKHSNSELSYKVQNALKEQCLRLLLFLLVKGEVTAVLGAITKRLRQQGASEIDASLVRYFVGGLLDALRPPFSLTLVRELGPMLLAPKCIDALRSPYFDSASKKRLSELVTSFREVIDKVDKSCVLEDSATVANLRNIYCS